MGKTVRLPPIMYRDFEFEIGERVEDGPDGEARYPISFSSELPVRRWSWDGPFNEVLSHKKGDVDLSRAVNGLPALKSHSQYDQFGSVTDIVLDAKAKVLRGMLGFSSIPLGQEQKTLVDEGHLRTLSVGYQVTELTLSKKAEGEDPEYLAKWIPLEVSTAPVPADHTVGIGRGATGDAANLVTVRVVDLTTGKHEKVSPATPETPTTETIRVVEKEPVRDFGKEAVQISEICAANGISERAAEFMRNQTTPGQVAMEVLELVRTKTPTTPPSSESLDMTKKDARLYSFARALRLQTEVKEGSRANYDGLERDVHQELLKTRRGEDHGGILVPWSLRSNSYEERVLGTGEATGGATLVGETVMPEMIDYLKNRSVILLAGARLYTGLTTVVHFNKKTGVPPVYWVAENPAAAVTGSPPAYGWVARPPKPLQGTVILPRQLVTLASIDAEADVRGDLGDGHGLAIDLGGLHGTGTAKQPEGIYSAADVQTKTVGGIPTYAKLTDFAGLLADANADLGNMSYVTTPLMASKMKQTQVVSGQAEMVWKGNFREGEMCGFPARATNQISKVLGTGADHGIIFGNWSDLVVGMWGNDLELVVDPYTLADFGQIKITSYSMADTAIRRGQSFVKALTAVIA